METVLIFGATGNIGASAVIGALHSGRNVLAAVRNQASAEKLFRNVGTQKGIQTVECDLSSDQSVQNIVDQVRAGKLPSFQHVYACVGGLYGATPMTKVSTDELRENFRVSFEPNFFAYRATVPYLIDQKNPNSTWTLCTGAQGSAGLRAAVAMPQGALFSMANAAAADTAESNVRFNEVYLAFRVEVDSSAEKSGATKASNFAVVYEDILARPEIKGCRVSAYGPEDCKDLKYRKLGQI